MVRIERVSPWVVCLGLSAALGTLPARAQELVGSVEGRVSNEEGAAVEGARIGVTREGAASRLETRSGAGGAFRFGALPPGRYAAEVTREGFETARVEGISVALGRALRVDVSLRVARAEGVTVSAEAPLLDLGQSGSFSTIRDEQLTRLPKGRDFLTVAPRSPSANLETKLGGLSIDGAGAPENRVLVDGIDTASLQNGLSSRPMPIDFVEEVQVKSSGLSAEHGGATGGVVSVLTRSGGDAFHGHVGAWYSSSGLDSAPRPTLRFKPDDDRETEYVTYPEDPSSRWEPGFAIGGPIVAGRAWFFAGYQPLLSSIDRTVTFVTTGSTGSWDQEEVTSFATANLSLQPSSRLFARVATNLSPYRRSGTLPSPDGASSPLVPYEDLGETRPGTSVSGTASFVASPVVSLGFSGGYHRTDVTDKGIPAVTRYGFEGSNSMYPEIPPALQRPSGFSNVATNQATEKDVNSRTSLQLDATFLLDGLGTHQLKAGVQYDRLANDVETGEQAPNVTLFWDRELTTLDGRRVRGTYGYYRVQQRQTRGDVTSDNVGLFLQDTWLIGSRLTVDVGLRSEAESVPNYSDQPGAPEYAIRFGFEDKLAPRLGVAWDVAGDGRWKAWGSWGLYYDVTKLTLPRSSFGGDKWLDYRYSLDTWEWPTLAGAGCPPACPGELYEIVDYRYEGTVDPDLEPMRSQELTLGLQHALGRTTSIGLRYVHKQLDEAVEDVGVIVPGVGEVYYIANPGRGLAEYTIGPEYPAQPRARREYDAVEVEATRRFADRWMLHASYVWSRLWGNYSGLASSDRYGRSTPNVDRVFDAITTSFDENARPVYGLLGTDRTHRFKVDALYAFPTGTSVGLSQLVASGTPVTRYVEMQSNVPVLYRGRGSDGRTPTLSQTDLSLRQEIRIGELTLELVADVLNLFDEDTATSVLSAETRDIIAIGNDDFFDGFDVQELVARQGTRRDPRFLQPDGFQAPRTVRLLARMSF